MAATPSRPAADVIAAGIDLGGTKLAAALYDPTWHSVAERQVPTPDTYPALLSALVAFIDWARQTSGADIPIGLGAAGLVNRQTGQVTAQHLAADGQRLFTDLAAASGREIAQLNDAAALALAEAHFGAGRRARRMLALAIGTGVGAALVRDGQLERGHAGTLGEVGQIPAPAHLVQAHDLTSQAQAVPGGAIEGLISGPGLTRIAQARIGSALAPETITQGKDDDPGLAQVWAIWCALVADLIRTLMLTVDPDCIVLGGGLSEVPALADDVKAALDPIVFAGFATPRIVTATGGATAATKGAAFAAWQALA